MVKKFFLLLVVLLLAWGVHWLLQPARLYLKFGKDEYGSYIVEVPYHIVKKRDCAAFEEWAKNSSPAFFAQKACPWAKPHISGEIGKFVINGVKFNIPRKYLYLEPRGGSADGEQGGLFVAFIYPDITPLTAQDWSKVNHYEITLSINGSKNRCDTLGGGRQCDIALANYQQATGISREKDTKPIFKKHATELNMDLYAWLHSWGEAGGFYVRGDPWRPDYWLDCGKNACETSMNYADNSVSVTYSFMTDTLLEKHDELRNKIINLLNEWSKNNE